MTQRPINSALVGLFLTAGAALAENVEIYLVDMLDNTQNGYCLDIAGGQGADADPGNGLQGHTCYSPSGSIFVDQAFDPDRIADGVLYMPEFDVCAGVTSTVAGAPVDLAVCDEGDAQTFVFSGEGSISPASASDMCFTLADDTRSGRSDANQIKALSLESCDQGRAANQTWSVRTAE